MWDRSIEKRLENITFPGPCNTDMSLLRVYMSALKGKEHSSAKGYNLMKAETALGLGWGEGHCAGLAKGCLSFLELKQI